MIVTDQPLLQISNGPIRKGDRRGRTFAQLRPEGLDTGDMLLSWQTPIEPEETAAELGPRLAVAGADLLVRTLANLDSIVPEKQNAALATYAPILKREDGKIDWNMNAGEILNRMRGFVPWPGCYGFLRGQRMHVWKAALFGEKIAPGELHVKDQHLYVGCGDSAIELLEVQLEGKKRMPAAPFLNGFPLDGNEVLS
jgi:methionyl-tRNA formyltransferase